MQEPALLGQKDRDPCSAPIDSSDVALKVLSGADALLGYWGSNQRCQFANEAYKTWFGKTPAELIGVPMSELLGPLYELNLPYVRKALAGEVQVFERIVPAPGGTARHSLATYIPDIANREVKGFSVHVCDVTRFKILERELESARQIAEHQATHDYLTGLPNRLHLVDCIDIALASARAERNLAAVMAIDFDNFKRINERFGHDAGDRILQELAHRMSRGLRSTDTVVRYGGDEFILVASGLSTWDPVLSTINRLRMIFCQPLPHRSFVIHPSFSCGVAVYPWHGKTAAQLMHRADRALYRAKAKGRGLVTFASVR